MFVLNRILSEVDVDLIADNRIVLLWHLEKILKGNLYCVDTFDGLR